MKRWLVWLVGLTILTGLVLIPALTYGIGGDTESTDVARIDDYRAEFTVDREGDLEVTETLTGPTPSTSTASSGSSTSPTPGTTGCG